MGTVQGVLGPRPPCLGNTKTGIFLENNFKYQNTHNNELGGAISANYRDFFSISCLQFDVLRGGMAPWYLVQGAISNFRALIPHPAGLGISLPKTERFT